LRRTRLETRRAFTLIELLLVVIIIGALAAMAVPKLYSRFVKAREKIARSNIDGGLATALKLFQVDAGRFPTTEEGLKVLIVKPPAVKDWQGPYVEKKSQLVDPWGNEYRYERPGTHGMDYDLFSLGPDGVQSEDDIGNWE
jgi:general secretion pathway protein G